MTFTVGNIWFKVAESEWELEAYFNLRRCVFVEEQKAFASSDVDEYDDGALHLVAVEEDSGKVVGGVRCYRKEGDLWFGGRLCVEQQYRASHVGSNLVRLAVASVKAAGCKQFLAYIQTQNVRFFEKRGWHSLGAPIMYHGFLHQLMEADLATAEATMSV
jgi:putative N-acetyltransferase (TIGR04045 family)